MKLIAAVFGALVAVVSADQAAITAKINADLEKSVPALTRHFTSIVAAKGLDPWKDAVPDFPLDIGIPFNGVVIPVKGTVSVGDITGLASGSIKSLILSDLTGDAGDVSGKITVKMDWSKNLTVALDAAVNATSISMDGDIAAGLFLQKLGVEAVVDAVFKVNSTSYCLESGSVNNVTTQFERVGTTKVDLLGKLKNLEFMIENELPKIDAEIVKNKDMVDKYLKSEVQKRVEEFMDDFIQTQKCKGGAGTSAEGNSKDINVSTKEAVEKAAAGLDDTSASASLVPSTVVALFVAACAIMN